MKDILLFATIIAPIILAFVEVLKMAIPIKKTYVPLVAVLVGLAVGYLSFPFSDLDVALRLWAGALGGLSSVGLFEMIKKQDGKVKGED